MEEQPKFKVGDRVVVANETFVAEGFTSATLGKILDDPPVGSPGTIYETKHYPVYGVLMDMDLPYKQHFLDKGLPPPLSGYDEDELEHYREAGN